MSDEYPLRSLADIQADVARILSGEADAAEAEAERTFPMCYGTEHPYHAWVRMYDLIKHRLRPDEHAFYQEGIALWWLAKAETEGS